MAKIKGTTVVAKGSKMIAAVVGKLGLKDKDKKKKGGATRKVTPPKRDVEGKVIF